MASNRIHHAYALSVALLIAAGLGIITWTPSPPERHSLWADEPSFAVVAPDPLLVFEPHGSAAESLFVSRGLGYSTLLAPDRMVMSMRAGERGKYHSVEMKVVGGNARAEGQALEPLESKTNYLIGNDRSQWRTDVPNFGRVKFDEVYPGIDLVYYDSRRALRPSQSKTLEYDFVVSPGADPSIIQLDFEGAKQLTVDSRGDLLLETAAGEVRHRKPFVYQEIAGVTRQVGGRYALGRERLVSFELGAYDPGHTLIIDPTILGSSYSGGDGLDSGRGLFLNRDGSIYFAGSASGNYPTTSGAWDPTPSGPSDCFVTKVGPDGEVVYATLLGGEATDVCTAAKVDGHGNVYATGFTNSDAYPQFPNASPTPAGFNSILTVLNSAGDNLLFSNISGGSGGEDGLVMALQNFLPEPSKAIVVAGIGGRTTSHDFNVTPDAPQGAHGGGGFDGFVELWMFQEGPEGDDLKFLNRSATYVGGSGEDSANAMEVAALREFATFLRVRGYYGLTTSTDDLPTFGQGYIAGSDAYTSFFSSDFRMDGSAGSAWAPQIGDYHGGSANDRLEDIAISRNSDAFALLISSNSQDLETTPGSLLENPPGGSEFINPRVHKIGSRLDFGELRPKGDDGGSLGEWSTHLGTSGTDTGKAIVFDRNGCVIVVGSTTSSEYPVTDDAPQTEYGGGATDAVVTRICDDGTRIDMSTYLGGPGADVANAVSIDAFDQVVVAGTAGAGFPTTPGAPQPDFGGGASDAFLTSIEQTFVARDGLVSSAKFSQAEGGGISPQEILTEFGAFVGPEVGVGLMFDQAGNVLREIGGTQVLVDGDAVPMVSDHSFKPASSRRAICCSRKALAELRPPSSSSSTATRRTRSPLRS